MFNLKIMQMNKRSSNYVSDWHSNSVIVPREVLNTCIGTNKSQSRFFNSRDPHGPSPEIKKDLSNNSKVVEHYFG